MSLFGSIQNTFITRFIRWIFRITVIDAENEPANINSYVICANHSSNWDPIVLGAVTTRPIRYMAKRILFKIPLLNLIIKLLGAYPVDRDAADVRSIKTTIQILKDGEVVGIYPQGRRSKKKHPRESALKNGAAMCAERAKVGILPITIISKGYKTRIFRKTIVVIGRFIPYGEKSAESAESNSNLSVYGMKTHEIFSVILENYEKYDILNKKAKN